MTKTQQHLEVMRTLKPGAMRGVEGIEREYRTSRSRGLLGDVTLDDWYVITMLCIAEKMIYAKTVASRQRLYALLHELELSCGPRAE